MNDEDMKNRLQQYPKRRSVIYGQQLKKKHMGGTEQIMDNCKKTLEDYQDDPGK
eukprot:CAMPEP_0170567500 /NCGR_PEP_ID=MMETSP0211-20121228/80519_1 /TAXON_ID=311385 /ORGANISM="Pseudokeronopsis sp., Strain OXSARD2" /LENGTH=53 /DNA_ID=CAMNT_0010888973 /DNA_START=1427 /DNA_END=1588 /DNA_ORIENTATION=-